VLKKTSHK